MLNSISNHNFFMNLNNNTGLNLQYTYVFSFYCINKENKEH